ncbi:hypothetical protein AB1Y20_019741 [Prymnesium parvum]|uniref:PH domain-containing protein n=1 Tax=Prymnesium parvum TaxID=97485 RepID=A0AB34JV71_PRYPA
MPERTPSLRIAVMAVRIPPSPHETPTRAELVLSPADAPHAGEPPSRDALALLTVGTQRCWLEGRRTVLLHLRVDASESPGGAAIVLVPAEDGFVCCMTLPASGGAPPLLEQLRAHAALLEARLPAGSTAGVSVAPPHHAIPSDVLASRVARSANVFHRTVLFAACAVGALCTAVSDGVATIMGSEARPPPHAAAETAAMLAPPPEAGAGGGAARRSSAPPADGEAAAPRDRRLDKLVVGLETARLSFQRISDLSDGVGRAVVRRSCESASHVASWSGQLVASAHPAAASPARSSRPSTPSPRPLASPADAPPPPPPPLPPTPPSAWAPALRAGGGGLVAAADSLSLARGLMYASLKRAGATVAAAAWGRAAGEVAEKSIEALSTARSAIGGFSGVAWLLHLPAWAADGRAQPRLVPSLVGGGGGADDDAWLLLCRPCKEGFIAWWADGGAREWGGWRRRWCVLHEHVLCLHEHQPAADATRTSAAETVVWGEVRTLRTYGEGGFELGLVGGEVVSLRAETAERRDEWLVEVMRLVAARAVASLSRAVEPEWEYVCVEGAAAGGAAGA